MRMVGVPYHPDYAELATEDYMFQANEIVSQLKKERVVGVTPEKEVVAIIAYLHKLGRDIHPGNNK